MKLQPTHILKLDVCWQPYEIYRKGTPVFSHHKGGNIAMLTRTGAVRHVSVKAPSCKEALAIFTKSHFRPFNKYFQKISAYSKRKN